MKLNKGDFVLIQSPLFGYSPDSGDFGPFICEVVELNAGIRLRHYLSKTSWAELIVSFETPFIKIHDKDINVLIKPSIKR